MESGKTICEVCHEEFDPESWEEMKVKYKDEIYHPGEDVSKLAYLTEDEKTERRKEVEEAFKNPEAYIAAPIFIPDDDEVDE